MMKELTKNDYESITVLLDKNIKYKIKDELINNIDGIETMDNLFITEEEYGKLNW